MQGLYRSGVEDSFVTVEQLQQEQNARERFRLEQEIRNGYKEPDFVTPQPQAKGYDYWMQRLIDRNRIYLETHDDPNNIEINFHDDSFVAVISDTHLGEVTDVQRLKDEIDAVCATDNAYIIFAGDICSAFFWNPPQSKQSEQAQEQYEAMYAIYDKVSKHKKLLAGIAGNHDLWISRSGVNPYTHFAERTGAYFIEGKMFLTANVGNTQFKITGTHEALGFSMYNGAHQGLRLYKFDGGEGSDIIFWGHSHRKVVHTEAVYGFGGVSRKVLYLGAGVYKKDDEYTRKKGYASRDVNSMYGTAFQITKDGDFEGYWGILEGLEKFKKEQLWKKK